MPDKKIPSNMGPRLIVECNAGYKERVEQTARERSFTSYKNYIVHVLNNDMDGLTTPIYAPKAKKKSQ